MPRLRRLTADDIPAYRSLRLTALIESPDVFSATVESEQALGNEQILSRIHSASHSGMWGVWNHNQVLVASLGLLHLTQDKLQHKASLYALYVAPCARGQGWGRQLMQTAISYARSTAQLRQLSLSVVAHNTAAQRMYTALGFVPYGCERDALCVGGTYYDEVLMQLQL